MLTRSLAAIAAFFVLTGTALAADFTQPERSPEFIQGARRQDKELSRYLGRLLPAGTAFNHLGSYQVMVHRNGLKRPLTLVPVDSLAFADAEALRSAARSNVVVVGALKLTYGQFEPEIVPGTLLLVYDGMRVHLRDYHGETIASFESKLTPAVNEAKIDPVVGKVGSSSASLANVRADNQFQLFLQLTNAKGTLLQGARGQAGNSGFSKVLLEFNVPGLVEDDDSPVRTLVEPKEDDSKVKPPKVFGR